MKTRASCVVTALLLFLAFSAGIVCGDDDAIFDKDMVTLGNAAKNRDFETTINMMYAPVVDACGGHKDMVAQAKAAADGISITSFEALKPYQKISGTKNDYAVIPVRILMEHGTEHFEIHSYEFAVRAHGSTQWQYVDGSGLQSDGQAMFFSDIPPDTALPRVTWKLIDSTDPDSAQGDSWHHGLLVGGGMLLGFVAFLVLTLAMYARMKAFFPGRPEEPPPPAI